MSQHKALVALSKGAKFIVSTRQTPKPGRDQVLIKVFAVALNPVDVWIEKYGSFMEEFPAVAGSDGAGTIEEIGEGVTNWSKGDRIVFPGAFFSANRGTFQQFAIADASRVAKIPESITFEEAATVPLGLSIAAAGTYSKERPEKGGAELTAPWTSAGRGKYQGQPAVVLGGSSSVGQYALQLLKLSGFSPIITTASATNEAYCKAVGATHFVDYRTTSYEDLPAAVASISSAPVTFVYDAISVESSQKAGWQILAAGGSMVVTLSPLVNSSKQGEDEDGKRLVWVGANVNREENHEIGDSLYAGLTGLLEEGAIKPNRIEVLQGGLEAIPAGLERLRKNEVSGVKLIALPWETA